MDAETMKIQKAVGTHFEKVKSTEQGKEANETTGAVRGKNSGRGRFDLISPIALLRLAKHYENGAFEYEERNWEKGLPLQRYLNSALRHLNNFLEGDRSEDHLAAVMWNVAGLIHTEEMILRGNLPDELNDLPRSFK